MACGPIAYLAKVPTHNKNTVAWVTIYKYLLYKECSVALVHMNNMKSSYCLI